MTSTDARKREQDARKREQDEMVKTAASLTASVEKLDPMPRALATADSSGFVDMAAFSASDPDWVENALATARGARGEEAVSDRPKPTPTVRGILLAPQTLRPVALSSLVEPPPSARRRVGAFAAGAIGACVAVVVVMLGVSAITRAPDALANAAMSDAIRDAALASLVAPTVASEPVAAPSASSSSAPVPAPSASSAPPAPTAKPRAKPAQVGGASPAYASPASPPRPRPPTGSPSLEEMMRRAAQGPSKPKK